jgi:flavin-dependent dehydrogenase
VGESLDWSAPELLKALGLPMEQLVESHMATWKRHVTVQLLDGSSQHYEPSTWLASAPFHIELRTLHLDRFRLDDELRKLAADHGIRFVRDKVVGVDRQEKTISSVRTASGQKISANWFVDASGFATSLLAREFKLPSVQYGPAKVALWNYFPAPKVIEGTTLYMSPSELEYLEWIWEIPINPDTVSVGYTTTGAAMKAKREQGLSVNEIFRQHLMKFPRFASAVEAGALSNLNVTSFRCRAHSGVAGPNWLIAGEAASMVDPMTANGVTAALRQASEAASLILKYRKRGSLPLRARTCYSRRVLQLAKFFNGGIEKILYEPHVRNRIGLIAAGTVYTSPAWTMNLVYARLKPVGMFSTFLFNSLLAVFRASAWVFYQACAPFYPQSVRAE